MKIRAGVQFDPGSNPTFFWMKEMKRTKLIPPFQV